MSVFEISSVENINQIVQSYETTGVAIVIKAYSTTCPPCNAVKGKYIEMADEYKQRAVFFQFDVTKCEELATTFDISAMPTFIVIKGRRVVKHIEGADIFSVRCAIDGI